MNYLQIEINKREIIEIEKELKSLNICLMQTKNAISTLLKNPIDNSRFNVSTNLQNTLADYFKSFLVIKDKLLLISSKISKNPEGAEELVDKCNKLRSLLSKLIDEVVKMYRKCERFQRSKIDYTDKEIKDILAKK